VTVTQPAGRLAGQLAVITAGTSGIGRAVAERFLAEGAEVIVTGVSEDKADDVRRELGAGAQVLIADASVEADLDRLRELVEQAGRPVDVVVANAGRDIDATPVVETSAADFDFVADLNFRGTFLTVQRLVPRMSEGGRIVLVSSIAGSNGGPGHAVYNATKAAIRSLARTLTAELGERGIRANAISPGPTATDGFAQFTGRSTEVEEAVRRMVPLRRIGRPEEIASAVLFLSSHESSFVSGAELVVDGGMSQV